MVERIFISYRREDSAGHAGRVFDRLKGDFGGDVLFMDVDAIPLGANFVRVLREEVGRCSVLLAIIGPGWLDARDGEGERRLENPNDFVRVEIATALQRDIPVIPILLEGARIPKAQSLPEDLQELAQRNGLDVRHASFHGDMDRLVRGLKAASAPKPVPQPIVAPVPSPPAKPSIEDLDLPLLPDGTIGIMETMDVPLVYGLIRSTFAMPAPVPTVDAVIAAKGKWVIDLGIDTKSETPPFSFSHLFMKIHSSAIGLEYATAGAIVSGNRWDQSVNPFWVPVHGHFAFDQPVCLSLGFLTYLGPTWRPEYAALSDAVFKKLGGLPLAHFVRHP